MKFVDEYRDAELGRVVAAEILSTVEPGPWTNSTFSGSRSPMPYL